MSIIIDHFSENSQSTQYTISQDTAEYSYISYQSFTAVSGTLDKCKFYLRKVGNPTGTVRAKLYAHAGTYGSTSVPTGSALATSEPVSVSEITANFGLITFQFIGDNRYNLIEGTYYCIAVEYTNGDATNYIDTGADNRSNYLFHSGNFGNGNTTDGLNPNAGAELCFYVYADGVAASTVSSGNTNKKRYFAKIYKPNNDYIGVWQDIKFGSFKQTINGGLGQLEINLARTFDDFGEGNDVKLNNEIQLYVHDGDTGPSGRLIYSGYISAYTPFIDGHNQGVKVSALGYYSKLKRSPLKSNINSFVKAFTSKDCVQVVKEIIDNYVAGTGLPAGHGFESKISWDNNSIPATTGSVLSYTFAQNTHAEAIEKMRQFSPADWWYFIGADKKLQFKSKGCNQRHRFIFGKDFKKVEVFKNMENVRNYLYFWNGLQDSDANVLKSQYFDLSSIQNYDPRWEQKTDGRVTVQATADFYGNALLSENKDPEIRTEVEILDNNGDNNGYDIESIQVGDTCDFRGFNDITSSTFTDNTMITGITYEPDKVTLELDNIQASVGRAIESIEAELEEITKTDAPTT